MFKSKKIFFKKRDYFVNYFSHPWKGYISEINSQFLLRRCSLENQRKTIIESWWRDVRYSSILHPLRFFRAQWLVISHLTAQLRCSSHARAHARTHTLTQSLLPVFRSWSDTENFYSNDRSILTLSPIETAHCWLPGPPTPIRPPSDPHSWEGVLLPPLNHLLMSFHLDVGAAYIFTFLHHEGWIDS